VFILTKTVYWKGVWNSY